MESTSKEVRTKIRTIKQEISRTKKYYSSQIQPLRQKESWLRQLAPASSIVPTMSEKRGRKLQDIREKISGLEKERDNKIGGLNKELNALKQDYRENYETYKKEEKENRINKIQDTKKDVRIFFDRYKYIIIGACIILTIVIVAIIISTVSNSIRIATEEGRNYYVNVDEHFTYDCNAKYDGGFSAYCEDRFITGSFSNYETVSFTWAADMEIKGNDFTKKVYDYIDPSAYQKEDFDLEVFKNGMDKKHYFDLRNNVLNRTVASKTVTIHYNLSDSDLALINQLHEKWVKDEAEKAAQAQREAEERATKEAEEQAAKAEAEKKAAEEQAAKAAEEARRLEEEAAKNKASDDPTQIPEDDVYDAVASCIDTLEQIYGVKAKTRNYSDGYWSGRDYEWIISFRNGNGFNLVTCSYNWKTGSTVIKNIN